MIIYAVIEKVVLFYTCVTFLLHVNLNGIYFEISSKFEQLLLLLFVFVETFIFLYHFILLNYPSVILIPLFLKHLFFF